MATFRCGRFPKGRVRIRTSVRLVDFHDGVATVDDEKVAAALREVPEVFQITEDDPPPARRARSKK